MRCNMTTPASFVLICNLLLPSSCAFQLSPRPSRRISRVFPVHYASLEDLESSTTLSSCPFSRNFPRYRLDLTTKSKPKEEKKFNLFARIQQSALRGQLEKKYGTIQWLPDEVSGVEAFAALWRATARIVSGETDSQVLAFPDSDARVLINFKELVDWIQDNMPEQARLEVTVDDDQVVQVSRVGGGILNGAPSIEVSPSDIEDRTKAWVKRLLVELSICPFTKSVTKSGQGLGDLGVPVGSIAYHTSASPKCVFRLMADTWNAMHEMVSAGPSGLSGVSSILLAAPAWDNDFGSWSGPFFCLLESSVVAAQAESQLGVVCFHPQYATPDGSSWPGFGHMHSVPRLEQWVTEQDGECPYSQDEVAAGGAWQRRTPHATINVLRADQLEQAESRRNTPELYARNINVLMEIGNDKLAEALEQERGMNSKS